MLPLTVNMYETVYENRLKKQIEEYEIKDKVQRKQDRLLNDRNNLMNERERKQDEKD